MTYGFRNTGPGLGQTQTCGGVIACNKIFVKWCLSQDRFHKHRLVLGPQRLTTTYHQEGGKI